MKLLIFGVLFILFGAVEAVANTCYLLHPNGVALARKQHRELPATVSPARMKQKMVTMLGIGLLFLAAGIYAFAAPAASSIPLLLTLIVFIVCMLAEAICYRQVIGFVFAGLGAVLLLLLCFL